jgi:Phytanoyl-CoA dioxygenase (PhyH)
MSRFREDLEFYTAKFRQFRARRPGSDLTSHPEYLEALRRDGIVMVDDFIGPAHIAEIVQEIEAKTDLLTERKSPAIVKRNARYLLLEPEKILPSTNIFFQNMTINGLARAYLSKDAVPDRPAVQLKIDVGEKAIVDFFHIDEWRYLISAFLLLTDVGPDEAPLVYLKGSHRQRLWRIPKEQEFFSYYDRRPDGQYANEESPYCGCFLPTEARRLRERYGYEQLVCTARAGTLIIFDNLGLHRSTELHQNMRLILSSYWMLPK